MGFMDLNSAFESVASVIRSIPRSELMIGAVAAMLAGWIGAALVRRRIAFGRALNLLSSLALGAILVTVVLLSSNREIMGEHANNIFFKIFAWFITIVISILSLMLIGKTIADMF